MSTSKKGFIAPLLLAFIALLLLGGGAYVYVQSNQTVQPAVIPPTTQTTSTDQTSNSQTVDWKTYTNTKFNYSIKYPSDLHIDDLNGTDPLSKHKQIPLDQRESFALINFKLDLRFFRGLLSPGQVMIKVDVYSSCQVSTADKLNGEEVIIYGVKAIKYVHIPDGEGGDDTVSFYGYFFPKIFGDKCLLVMLRPYPADHSFVQKFDQIISTLKFNP